jgi:beta-glucosidase
VEADAAPACRFFTLLPIGISNAQATVPAPEAHSKPIIAKRGASDPIERAKVLLGQMMLGEKLAQIPRIRTGERFQYVPGVPRLHIPSLGITNRRVGAGKEQKLPQLQAIALPASISVAASWNPDSRPTL